jgi:hypothetical protein
VRQPQDSAGREIAVGDRVSWRGQIYTIKAFGDPVEPLGTLAIEFEEPLHLEGEVPEESSVNRVVNRVVSLDQLFEQMPLITQFETVHVEFHAYGGRQVRAAILSTCLGTRDVVFWHDVPEDEIEGSGLARHVRPGPALRHGAQLLRELATQWEQEAARVDQETP